jgi:hypothetical protein
MPVITVMNFIFTRATTIGGWVLSEKLTVVQLAKKLPAFYRIPKFTVRSRVSSGSIVSDYGLDDREIAVRSPAGANDFSYSLCVQIGSGAHPASCTMGTGGKSAAGA